MELSIIYVSKSIDDNKVSGTSPFNGSTRAAMFLVWGHCHPLILTTDPAGTLIWDLPTTFAKPRTEMDLVLDVISDALLHWGEISAFPFLKGSCSWAIMFIPISPGIILCCLASWLAGLYTTKIPLHGIMTPKASMSSSRYPAYGIASPFAAVNLNQLPVGKTGFPWGQKWSLKNWPLGTFQQLFCILWTYPYLSHCCPLLSLGSLWHGELVLWKTQIAVVLEEQLRTGLSALQCLSLLHPLPSFQHPPHYPPPGMVWSIHVSRNSCSLFHRMLNCRSAWFTLPSLSFPCSLNMATNVWNSGSPCEI